MTIATIVLIACFSLIACNNGYDGFAVDLNASSRLSGVIKWMCTLVNSAI